VPEEKKTVSFLTFDDATLQALDAAHGEIRVVRGKKPPAKKWDSSFVPDYPWEAVFRVPTMGESDTFEGTAHNDKARSGGLRNLAKAIVVGVSYGGQRTVCTDRADKASERAVREAWESLRKEFPGAHMAAQDDIMSLASMAADEEGKL
jgi:hypothetical protein